MIRIAVAVATEDAMPDAFVVWRGVEPSIRKAAEFGYDGIELALQTAEQVDPDRVGGLLDEHGLQMPCISTGQVFSGLGLYFTATDPAKRAEVIRVFQGMIDLAAGFGACVNVGRARGFVEDGESLEAAEGRFIDVARELAAYAEPKHVTLVLEPVNRYEINFINSLPEGAALVRKVGAPNMALMADLFHMNIEEVNVEKALRAAGKMIAHVHLSDSNRGLPGEGHVDFARAFKVLREIGYDGYLAVEATPLVDGMKGLEGCAAFLREAMGTAGVVKKSGSRGRSRKPAAPRAAASVRAKPAEKKTSEGGRSQKKTTGRGRSRKKASGQPAAEKKASGQPAAEKKTTGQAAAKKKSSGRRRRSRSRSSS